MRAARRLMANNPGVVPIPLTIGNLFAWYAADLITGQADGATLASWADKSGNGHTLSQGTGGAQPTFYKTTSAKLVNGLPAVWFSGAQYLTTAALTLAQPATYLLVVQFTGTLSGTPTIASSSASGSRQQTTYTTSAMQMYAGTALLTTGHASDANVDVLTCTYNGASSSFRRNGSSLATGNAGSFSQSPLRIGADSTPANFWTGPICEVLAYSAALTGPQITTVENYLTTKWG